MKQPGTVRIFWKKKQSGEGEHQVF